MNIVRPILHLTCALPLAITAAAQYDTALAPAAQLPAQPVAQSQRLQIHTTSNDPTGASYGIWAAGNGYKASFHNGMTFVPMLGKSAPETVALSWSTTSIRVGELELLNGTPATPHQASSFRYEYHHGTVVEAYDVLEAGLEQTFVLKYRPTSAGDLVITGSVAGNVATQNRIAKHSDILFAGPRGRQVIRYGKATAIDANGQRIPMTTAVVDGKVQLRLTAQWVRDAAYPLTVDPILGNNLLATAQHLTDVDVFCDGEQQNQNVWMIYSQHASANDADLIIRRYPSNLSSIGVTVFSDITSSWSTTEGQLAGLGGSGAGKVIGAFTRDFFTGERRVRWHLHQKSDLTLKTGFGSIPWTSGTNEWRPDVGGTKASVVGNTALIVFQRETGATFSNTTNSEIIGTKIDVSTGLNGTVTTAALELGGNGLSDEERPSINQVAEGGVQFSWLIAFQVHNNSTTGNWNVAAQRVNATFGSLGNPRYIAQSASHEMGPQVAGAEGRYLIAYGKATPLVSKPTSELANMAACRRITWPHTAPNGLIPYPEEDLRFTSNYTLRVGACAFDSESRSHWAVTTTNEASGIEDLRVTKLGFDGEEIEQVTAHSVAGFTPKNGGICFDEQRGDFALAFGVDNNTISNTLWATRMTYEDVLPPTLYGVSCATNAAVSYQGTQHVGSEFETLKLNSTFPNGAVLLGVSLAPSNFSLSAFGMTNCQLAINPFSPDLVGSVLLTTNAAGNTELTLPLPSAMPAIDLFCQWLLLDPNANPAGVSTSHGLVVPLGR